MIIVFATFKPCGSGKKNKSSKEGWKFTSFDMRLHWWYALAPIWQDSSVFLFRVRNSNKGLNDVGLLTVQHKGVYTPNNTASHLWRNEFLVMQLWKSEIYHVKRMSDLRLPQWWCGEFVCSRTWICVGCSFETSETTRPEWQKNVLEAWC